MSKRKYTLEREDLNLNNIKKGQIVKSYRELCSLLEIKVLSGNSKLSQIKELEQYIDFEKFEGNKLIIKDIYIIKKEKVDKRKDGNHSVYRDDFASVLSGILYKTKSKSYLCSRGRLIEQLGFINENYRNCRSNLVKTAEELKIPEENLLDFYMSNDTRIIKSVESNLQYFEGRSYYFLDKVTAVCIKSEPINIHRIATDDEKDLILKCANKVKLELGIQSDSEIFYKQLWNTYNDKIKEELKKRGSNILYYYKAYYFVMSRDKIEELYKKYIKDKKTTVTKSKKELNKKSKDSAMESLSTRQENAIKRISEGKNKKFAMQRDILLTDNDFKKYGKKIVNNLISTNAKTIQLSIFEDQNDILFDDEDNN